MGIDDHCVLRELCVCVWVCVCIYAQIHVWNLAPDKSNIANKTNLRIPIPAEMV